MTVHRILKRQIKRASDGNDVDYEKIFEMVSQTYEEYEETRRRSERTNATLEEEVMSLNAQIQIKINNIQTLLNTIDQGIFTFGEDLLINPSFSANAILFFGLEENKVNTLKSAFDLSEDQEEVFRVWTGNVFSAKSIQRWKKFERIVPVSEMTSLRDRRPRIIALDYKPVFEDEKLVSIMVLGSDVTKSRAVATELAQQKSHQLRHAEHVDAFFSNDQSSLHMFMKELNEVWEGLSGTLEILKSPDFPENIREKLETLYCLIHTLKGSGGSYGFTNLSGICHKTEDALDHLLKNWTPAKAEPAIFWDLKAEIDLIREFWDQLRSYNELAGTIPVRKEAYEGLCKQVRRKEIPVQLGRDLLHTVMNLTAISADSFARKYHRIIDNLRKKYDYYLDDLRIQAEDGCIDSELAYRLDPVLVHLIRNSVDHGMQTRPQRERAGKGPGNIQLCILRKSDHYQISLEDDGKGIDTDKVLKAAIAHGLISEDKARSLSHQEKTNLIFLPMLSTKEHVSSVSGRGVGVYSVKLSIEKYGGKIQVFSTMGKGTRFELTLPVKNPG